MTTTATRTTTVSGIILQYTKIVHLNYVTTFILITSHIPRTNIISYCFMLCQMYMLYRSPPKKKIHRKFNWCTTTNAQHMQMKLNSTFGML